MPLHRKGTIVYFDTHNPTQKELNTGTNINLSIQHTWNPLKVDFVQNQHSLQEEIERILHASNVTNDITWSTAESRVDEIDFIFSLSEISCKISAMGMGSETEKVDTSLPQETLQRPEPSLGR